MTDKNIWLKAKKIENIQYKFYMIFGQKIKKKRIKI
jgi:hypothetical protein